MGSLDITGFDDLEKQLKQMQRAAKELEGTHEISFEKLFTKSFMKKYTNYSTFDELLDAGNFVVNSQEDLEAIPPDEFDKHISQCTRFDTWEDMLGEATQFFVSIKLGF